MSKLTDEDFRALLGRLRVPASGIEQPETLEDVIRKNTAKASVDIRPQTHGQVLPMPRKGMNLNELSELMKKYKRVVEAGAYLVVWTDFAGTPNVTTDPELEGRRSMSETEEKAYDWFKTFGNKDEFDWNECVKASFTSAAKESKLANEVNALRVMYTNNDLNAENLYWIRDNRPAHFVVVKAFAKILRADNDIRQGVGMGNAYDYKEYQTCNKLIATAGAIVNDFMALIRKLTKPIEQANQIIISRRYEMGTRCAIQGRPPGGSVRMARELGIALPPVAGAPSGSPSARRTVRETVRTLEELRTSPVGKAVSRLPPPESILGQKRKSTHDDESWGRERTPDIPSPEPYRPKSPERDTLHQVAFGLQQTEGEKLINKIRHDERGANVALAIGALKLQDDDDEIIKKLDVRRGVGGIVQIAQSTG
jgi:hypothetical protein